MFHRIISGILFYGASINLIVAQGHILLRRFTEGDCSVDNYFETNWIVFSLHITDY